MSTVSAFQEALQVEDLSMMDELLQNMGEENPVQELDEMTVRKMILKRSFLLKEEERLKNLKKAVVEEWDHLIKKNSDAIKNLESLIEYYIKTHNYGRKLQYDVGTAYLTKRKPKLKVKSKMKLEQYLEAEGIKDQFLTSQVDHRKAANYILRKIEDDPDLIDQLPEEVFEYEPETKTLSIRMNKE